MLETRLMKPLYLLFGFLILQQTIVAQLPPWNAKFIVYHPEGYTDSLWVGCDENAADGFDEGLDSLDNSFEYPISIGAYSPEVDMEFGLDNCVNLKKEILPFANVRQYTFYIVYDNEVISEPVQIKWDSLDFIYHYDEFMIYQATLIAQTGYVEAIDNTIWGFFSRDSNNPDNVFISENPYIDLYAESSALECIPNNNVIKLRLDVTFKDYSLNVNQNFYTLDEIFPNPFQNTITIKSATNLKELKIYDINGRCVLIKDNIHASDFVLDLHLLLSGSIYLLTVLTDDTYYNYKLIKN